MAALYALHVSSALTDLWKLRDSMKQIEDKLISAFVRTEKTELGPLNEVCKEMSSDIASLLLLSKKIEELTPPVPLAHVPACEPRPSA